MKKFKNLFQEAINLGINPNLFKNELWFLVHI